MAPSVEWPGFPGRRRHRFRGRAGPSDTRDTLPSRQSPLEDPRSRTMTVLRSYVSGAWVSPADYGHDDGRPVLNAVTGEEVARVSSTGIAVGAALAYGRGTGGPALRELTFHQRAGILKQLGLFLREHRPELYE